jgi:hypothetical protein
MSSYSFVVLVSVDLDTGNIFLQYLLIIWNRYRELTITEREHFHGGFALFSERKLLKVVTATSELHCHFIMNSHVVYVN